MTIIFGILEFGQAVWKYNTVASLAKEAARYASVHGSKSGTPADSAAVQTYVDSRTPNFAVIARTTWPDGGTTPNAPGNKVQVSVETTFTPMTKIVPQGTHTLRSTAQVIIAR